MRGRFIRNGLLDGSENLDQIVSVIYEHPEFFCSDPVVFVSKLKKIASGYCIAKGKERLSIERRRYFIEIAKLAGRLNRALSLLNESELQCLSLEQKNAFSASLACSENDEQSGYEFCDSDSYPHFASAIWSLDELKWLQLGAERLSSNGRKGRPDNFVEREAARRLVELCLREGWQLGVSNSGKTVKLDSVAVESEVVLILASIFCEAGIGRELCIGRAKSALRKVRDGVVFQEWSERLYDNDRVSYFLNFQGIHCLDNFFDDLPNFTPKTVVSSDLSENSDQSGWERFYEKIQLIQ